MQYMEVAASCGAQGRGAPVSGQRGLRAQPSARRGRLDQTGSGSSALASSSAAAHSGTLTGAPATAPFRSSGDALGTGAEARKRFSHPGQTARFRPTPGLAQALCAVCSLHGRPRRRRHKGSLGGPFTQGVLSISP